MQAYRQLQALDKSSAASAQMLAQLARASADTDPAGARQMQARLPPHQQPSELDVDALEAAWAGRLSLIACPRGNTKLCCPASRGCRGSDAQPPGLQG